MPGGAQRDTILSGVVSLWDSGVWPVAVVILVASIVIPIVKLLALAFLLVLRRIRLEPGPAAAGAPLSFDRPHRSLVDDRHLRGGLGCSAGPIPRRRHGAGRSGGGGVRGRRGADDVRHRCVRSSPHLGRGAGGPMMEGSPPPPDRPLGRDDSELPEAVVARPSRFLPELVWTIPLVAVLIAGWLGFQALHSRGPTITIQFRAARWLAVGKTKVKYREVDVGEVRAIGFSRDRRTVVVTARLNRDAAPWMVEDTRFWIVEPRVGAGEISGLETLLSGAYIALDVGQSKRPRHQFEGLPMPPVVAGDTPGRAFIARAHRGISVGSPIFFRHMEVGQVTGSDLNRDGTCVVVNMFVRAPYDRYVTTGNAVLGGERDPRLDRCQWGPAGDGVPGDRASGWHRFRTGARQRGRAAGARQPRVRAVSQPPGGDEATRRCVGGLSPRLPSVGTGARRRRARRFSGHPHW